MDDNPPPPPVSPPLSVEDFLNYECNHFRPETMFLQTEQFPSWGLEEALLYEGSSPEGMASSSEASKNILTERRKKFNDQVLALRSVVPNITKMDKASVIKDAVNYIQELMDQEKRIEAEISDLESWNFNESLESDFQDQTVVPNKKRINGSSSYDSTESDRSLSFPIEILHLSVNNIGEKTTVVSLACSRREDTTLKLCRVIDSLKLKIVTSTVNVDQERVLTTLFIEAEEMDEGELKKTIEGAIAAVSNDLSSPISK